MLALPTKDAPPEVYDRVRTYEMRKWLTTAVTVVTVLLGAGLCGLLAYDNALSGTAFAWISIGMAAIMALNITAMWVLPTIMYRRHKAAGNIVEFHGIEEVEAALLLLSKMLHAGIDDQAAAMHRAVDQHILRMAYEGASMDDLLTELEVLARDLPHTSTEKG